jgi:hypothetical protein
VNDDVLTIRFALDKTYLVEPFSSTDHPILVYDGPNNLESLTCRQCQTNLLKEGSKLKIKGAPSENWREVIELWQCHNESFEKLVNPETQ